MKEEEKSRKIKSLIDQLETLSLESLRITREIKVLQEEEKTSKLSNNNLQILFKRDNPFKIGDEVVITNNYLQQRGKKGVITNTSKRQVTIHNTNTGTVYKRAYKNVRHI
jgi:hypothetical protein